MRTSTAHTPALLATAITAQLALWGALAALEDDMNVVDIDDACDRIRSTVRVLAGSGQSPGTINPADVDHFVTRVNSGAAAHSDKHSNESELRVYASFMALGMDALPAPGDMNAVLKHWDGGHLELVSRLSSYAPLCDRMIKTGFAIVGDLPGVTDYEIAEPFGAWFGEQVLAAPDAMTEPSPSACADKLRELTLEFFTTDVAAGPLPALKIALAAVH